MIRIDYYELLGVERTAAEGEIKSAYRRLALRYHPDRNGGDPQAEERFKAISEAYAVLADPTKRAAYDLASRGGRTSFDFTRQDIFADLLRRMNGGGFRDLGPEFARSGLRFDEAFLRQVFFGAGPFVVSGLFFSSFPGRAASFAGPVQPRRATLAGRLLAPVGRWLLRQAGRAALAMVGAGLRRLDQHLCAQQEGSGDLTYRLSVSRREAREGTSLELSYPQGGKLQKVAVKIPAGTTSGATLRVSGMGHVRHGQRGDLLLIVDVL